MTAIDVTLTRDGSEARQDRFRTLLSERSLDAAAITDLREIHYLTGLDLNPEPTFAFPAFLYMEAAGGSWLACHSEDGDPLVDDRFAYPPHTSFTMNPDPMRLLAALVAERLSGPASGIQIGYQAESLPRLIGETVEGALHPGSWIAIDDEIAAMERRKDADEIAMLRRAIACSLAAYDADRATIGPGVNELAVLEAGHRAATFAAGESMFHAGDYRCGAMGGFARDREIPAGELYVIDAWSHTRGYWSDLCRTFAVSEPTPLQQEIFDLIVAIHADLPEHIRPGVRGTELAAWIDGRLRQHPHLRDIGLTHHAGHGIGLRAHEGPDLNLEREGIIQLGDTLCVEPGAYAPELNGGIRLENTYLVTEAGIENLSDYPMRLR